MVSEQTSWKRGASRAPALFVAIAEAQQSPGGLAPAAPTAPSDGGGGLLLFVVLMLGLTVILGAGVKLMDWRRRRMEQAVQIQARIADALMLDPELVNVAVTATVTLPFWHKSPATVDVHGRVPSPRLRDAALNLVIREATASGLESRIEDRMVVAPAASQRAA